MKTLWTGKVSIEAWVKQLKLYSLLMWSFWLITFLTVEFSLFFLGSQLFSYPIIIISLLFAGFAFLLFIILERMEYKHAHYSLSNQIISYRSRTTQRNISLNKISRIILKLNLKIPEVKPIGSLYFYDHQHKRAFMEFKNVKDVETPLKLFKNLLPNVEIKRESQNVQKPKIKTNLHLSDSESSLINIEKQFYRYVKISMGLNLIIVYSLQIISWLLLPSGQELVHLSITIPITFCCFFIYLIGYFKCIKSHNY